ncbi:MAG: DHH family phosphoesterase [Sulfolobales archaeon]|jgi:nanoRNase/pAp phosphatase (c-di-AMP/oligoRNAs hydrolase)
MDLLYVLKKIFSTEDIKRVDIVSHPSADIDSVASALALSLLIRSISSAEICFLAPQGLDPIASKVIDLVKEKGFMKLCNDFSGDVLFIVDASSCNRVNAPCSRYNHVIVIDHHSETVVEKESINFIVPESTSSTEIILRVFERENLEIGDKDLLTIFLSAILYETGLLTNYTEETDNNIKWLIKKGASLAQALSIIRREFRYDEKIARLKGLSRIHVYRTSDRRIICLTHISAHESLVASQMISAGCDLAIVISDKDYEKWVIARCSENICSDKDLGEIFLDEISKKYNGSWGGHKRAAMSKIPKEDLGIDTLYSEIVSILSRKFGKIEKIVP